MADENAELGIAQTQAKASQNRMSQKDGLEVQQAWSSRFFNERITVYLLALCFLAFVTVWAVSVPMSIRLAVTAATFLVGVNIIITRNRNKRLTRETRARQVREHSSDRLGKRR